jgi:hypothetical protein
VLRFTEPGRALSTAVQRDLLPHLDKAVTKERASWKGATFGWSGAGLSLASSKDFKISSIEEIGFTRSCIAKLRLIRGGVV